MERRLAAILYADVAGYSRLVGADEEGTHRLFRSHFDALNAIIEGHGGRVVHTAGDAVLAEFTSVVTALKCAVAAQLDLAERNRDLPDDRKLQFRIGVNLGDVIIDREEIYGNGVNVAARLETLADPGGICVSSAVVDQVEGTVPIGFEDLGRQSVKNISKPIRAYRAVLARSGSEPSSQEAKRSHKASDKPSIAVLPFTNMSGDPEQEFFSDGITEDITAALSRFHELTVIARNSCFAYKGKAVNVKEVARELGVKYVIEGSVRRGGDRIRVNVQLIDALRDAHIWAERYDRVLADIFAVQDEITEAVVATVAPETLKAEIVRASSHQDAQDLGVWEQVMRARFHMNKFTKKDNAIAHSLLVEAISKMPDLGLAHSTKSVCHLNDMLHAWCADPAEAIQSAEVSAREAVAIDDADASAIAVLGIALMFARRFNASLEYLGRATRLNPNLASGYGFLATLHGVMGNYGACAESLERALRLSPLDPLRTFWYAGRGIAAYIDEQYEEVVENAKAVLREAPNNGSALRQLAAALAMLGRDDEAREVMANIRIQMPDLTVSQVRTMIPVQNPSAAERWLGGLRRAGLPE